MLKSQWEAVRQLEKNLKGNLLDYDFQPRKLVIIRNSKFDKSLSDKTQLHYFGPMIMVKRTKGGSYVLGELDGSLSKLRFVAFQLLPYQPRDIKAVPVTHFSEDLMGDLEDKTHDSGNTLDVIGEVEA